MNKKFKLVAPTASARIGAVLLVVSFVAAIVTLILQGVLNFADTLWITIGVIAAAAIISAILICKNFGRYLIFDLNKNEFVLYCDFKKTVYSLDRISKVQIEAKTIDLHLIDKTTKQEIKCGAGCITQTEYKKVHYKMPTHKDLDQRKRFDEFARKCNKILKEVVHKKQVKEVYRDKLTVVSGSDE
jgi:hypothetical protein